MAVSAADTKKTFQDVKSSADLQRYIEQVTGTTGKRTGSSVFFNPCPLCGHQDCFTLFGENLHAWKCHSCGEGGDIFTFAQKKEGMDAGESLRAVAAFAGVTLPDLAQGETPRQNPLQRVLEAAVAHYRAVLAGRADILEYLTGAKPGGRGHGARTLELMECGCSDGKLWEALQRQGFGLDEIKNAGLYVESRKSPGEWGDFFVPNLVIFPHRLPSGELAHFTLKDPRKKLTYQFRAEHRLDGFAFGNQKAIKSDTVILCEGENDLGSFFDAGVRNVLASLGSLSDEQIRWLDTYGTGKTFVTWFDYDTKWGDDGQPPAGIRYTRKVYQRLLKNPDCKVLVASGLMAPGEDPDDWIQRDLPTASKRIAAAVKKAHNPLLWELRVMPADIKADADAALRYLNEIEFFEHLGILSELQRDAVITELQKLGFSRDAVLDGIKEQYGLREVLEALVGSFNNSVRSDAYKRACSTAIWDYFKARGRFFVSGDKLCLFYQHQIYQLGDNVPFKALLHREAGINAKQEVAGFVFEELKALTYSRGDRLAELGWCSVLQGDAGPVLYLNLKDPANRILQVSAGSVDIAENGTNPHNVLLAQSNQMKPFRYDPDVGVAAAMHGLQALVLDSLSCEPAQRYLVLAWALSSYLMPFTTSRALMKMEGGSGSGKTTAAKFLSLLLYGENMVGRSSTASDYSMAATEPLIIKDNLETDDMNRNALNFLLLAATGATNIKREQGTASGVVSEKINCLVAITAIEPFAKPELINRTFIVDFSKKWQRADFVENECERVIVARRDELISAWLHVLSERVLTELPGRGEIVKYIREQHKNFSKDRLADFTALLTVICKALLRYMPLPAELRLEAGDRAPEYVLLDAWIKYQDEHARQIEQGTNAVLQLLEGLRRMYLIDYSRKEAEPVSAQGVIAFGENRTKLWCELMGIDVFREELADEHDPLVKRQTYYFDVGTAGLLSILNRFGREYGVKIPFSNPRQFGVRIANEMDTLQRAGWTIGYVRKVHGERISRWQWTDDAQAK